MEVFLEVTRTQQHARREGIRKSSEPRNHQGVQNIGAKHEILDPSNYQKVIYCGYLSSIY
jgi:hypothetical protein